MSEETTGETRGIDPRFVVNLKGKLYPTFPGVLDAATRAGLKSLETTIVQIPSADNNHMAVVMVRAEFEDGRAFTSVGDASPANCSPGIATAALRMAETRAAGRALRNAVNCGMTLLEELPDDDPMAGAKHPAGAPGNGPAAVRAPQSPAGGNVAVAARPAAGDGDGEALVCSVCKGALTAGQAQVSQRSFGSLLCPTHQKQANRLN